MNEIAFVLKPPLNRRIISSNSNNSHSSLSIIVHSFFPTPCHIHNRHWAVRAPLPQPRLANAAH